MKKRGAILTAAAAFAPITGIFLISFAMFLHAYFPDLLIIAVSVLLQAVNPDAPFQTTNWIDHSIKLFGFWFISLSPVFLYGAIVRFVTPAAEKVYLKFKLSLLTFAASAFGGMFLTAVNEWIYTKSISSDLSKYPNRSLFLGVLIFLSAIGFIAFSVIYIIQQKRTKDAEGNLLPKRVVLLDLLRCVLALPAFILFFTALWKILLIFFSDAFY